LEEARRRLAAWRDDYNHNRPHSALDDRSPAVFAALHGVRTKRFARSEPNTANGEPHQGFASPADTALDLARRLPEDIHYAGEALFRIAQTRGPLLSLWSDFQARKWARKVLSSRKSHFHLVRETVAGQTRISLVMTGRNSGGRPPVADLIKSPRFDPVGATRRGVHSTE